MLGLALGARVLSVLTGFGAGCAAENAHDVKFVSGEIPPNPLGCVLDGFRLLPVLHKLNR
jgi:hypothetical protein